MRRTQTIFLAMAVWTMTLPSISLAQKEGPAEQQLRAMQSWHSQCTATGCILSVDILRGDSGDPPDSKDEHQYVSIAVGVDRVTKKPSMVMFEVDPSADQSSGVELAFGRSVKTKDGWSLELDKQLSQTLPLNHCSQDTCDAIIGGGHQEAACAACESIIDRMESESHLFLAYRRGKHLYSTAVTLYLFNEAYRRMLEKELTSSNDSPEPGNIGAASGVSTNMLRREFLKGLSAFAAAPLTSSDKPTRLAQAARAQIGVTTTYDPRYVRIPYPNGDVPRNTGVCADVIVRAYRDALALDLQKLLHEDMTGNFAAYPKTWGMTHPDANIDHRRVLNLETFWRRAIGQLWQASTPTAGNAFPAPLAIGDILTWRLDARLPHVGLVSDVSTGLFGTRIRVIHNWGNGAEDLPSGASHRTAPSDTSAGGSHDRPPRTRNSTNFVQ